MRKVTFKSYSVGQMSLLPQSLEELIPEGHLVRVVNAMLDRIDLKPLIARYEGGGASSYHPLMMLKVLVYAYSEKTYSSRRIAKALRENVNYMWLSGGNQPDHRTLNNFRSGVLKEVVREVFASVVALLAEDGYVKLENYFVDGTKIEANANAHKVVWAKRTANYKSKLREKIKLLLDEIERINEAEDAEYGEKDLDEMGAGKEITSEKLKEKMAELNERLRQQPTDKPLKKAVKTLEKDCLPRLEKYEEQERVLDGRTSYSKTDPDASSLRMKEDRAAEKPLPRPGYNLQNGTEGQFIIGYSVHQSAGDPGCFVPHMEAQKFPHMKMPEKAVGDAAYGSEENYAWLEKYKIGNYLKYARFHKEEHPPRKPELREKERFVSANFPYDPEKDEFSCPAGHPMSYQETRPYKTRNGYLSERRFYEADQCQTCPLKPQCTKAKGNRRIQVSFKLRAYQQQARQNLTSEQGVELRKKRATDVETPFGNIKQNMGYRRFLLRGMKKVGTEWGLVCIAHNMRKLAV